MVVRIGAGRFARACRALGDEAYPESREGGDDRDDDKRDQKGKQHNGDHLGVSEINGVCLSRYCPSCTERAPVHRLD